MKKNNAEKYKKEHKKKIKNKESKTKKERCFDETVLNLRPSLEDTTDTIQGFATTRCMLKMTIKDLWPFQNY